MRAVDAYGIEYEDEKRIEIWAECGGLRQDPKTGNAVFGAERQHEKMKGSITIKKGPGWSPNRFRQIIAEQAFFPVDGGDREWTQDISPDGVGKRWGAG